MNEHNKKCNDCFWGNVPNCADEDQTTEHDCEFYYPLDLDEEWEISMEDYRRDYKERVEAYLEYLRELETAKGE